MKTRSVMATEASAGVYGLAMGVDAATGRGVRTPAAERRTSERRPGRHRVIGMSDVYLGPALSLFAPRHPCSAGNCS